MAGLIEIIFILILSSCYTVKSEVKTVDMSYEYMEKTTYFFYAHHYLKMTPDQINGMDPETGKWYIF